MPTHEIHTKLKYNEAHIKHTLGGSSDLVFRYFAIPGFHKRQALLVYVDGLVADMTIYDSIIGPLISEFQFTEDMVKADAIESLMEAGVYTSSVEIVDQWAPALDKLMRGDTLTMIQGCTSLMIHSTRGYEARGVSEPVTEGVIRGPRDGFVETLRSNTSLLRRRIKDTNLRFDVMSIGERTKTDVCLAYVDDLVDKGILSELHRRLSTIKVDSILESGYLEEFIEDSPYSPFPQIEHTERPDKAAAAILEGRIAIMCDNTPFVLMVPTMFWQYLQSSEDYYERYHIAIAIRWLRILTLIISFTLSSVYLLLVSFHHEMLPTPLALAVAGGRVGIPFPAVIEVLLMEGMFEVLREAGIRMPKQIGQAVSIVGALVIGDAAVTAGLASPSVIIVVAAAGISSISMPAYSTAYAFRLIRFPLLLLTGMLGVFGFLFGTIFTTMHLLSLRSFGVPFLAPIAPLRTRQSRDVLGRPPWWSQEFRPELAEDGDQIRQKKDAKASPAKDPGSQGKRGKGGEK